VRPRRVVRFARLVHAARPRSWRTFGPRRLRRHLKPALVATQGGAAGLPRYFSTTALGSSDRLATGRSGPRSTPLALPQRSRLTLSQRGGGQVLALIGVIIAAATLLITWLSYRARRSRLDHEFVSGARLLSDDAAHLPTQLEVRYQDEVLHRPYLQIVRLINAGPREIKEDDFRMPIRIELGVPVIAVHVAKTRPPEIAPRVRRDATAAVVEPMLFNRQDWIGLSILTDGEPTHRRVELRAVNTAESRPFRVPNREQWLPGTVAALVGVLSFILFVLVWGALVFVPAPKGSSKPYSIRPPLPEWADTVGIFVVMALAITGAFLAWNLALRWVRRTVESFRIF
jgi:hypothetical protein